MLNPKKSYAHVGCVVRIIFCLIAAAHPAFASVDEANAQLAILQQTKIDIRNAVNFRRADSLSEASSFASYPDAVEKICGGTLSPTPATPRSDIAPMLSDANNTKQGIKSAIRTLGTPVSDSEPFADYAKKIRAINCPDSPGYADENVITQTTNPEDNESFQCANATVCEVLSKATACHANNILANSVMTAACV
jgi:hypothetical protein